MEMDKTALRRAWREWECKQRGWGGVRGVQENLRQVGEDKKTEVVTKDRTIRDSNV